jgi:hypothetical protein
VVVVVEVDVDVELDVEAEVTGAAALCETGMHAAMTTAAMKDANNHRARRRIEEVSVVGRTFSTDS